MGNQWLRMRMPRIESDSKRTGLVPPTVGRKPRSARRIQRAPTVPSPPQRVAVEARPCAWAGRARSCGGRPGAARLAPSAERRRRAAGRFGLGPVGRAPGPREAGAGAAGRGRQTDQIGVGRHDLGLLLSMKAICGRGKLAQQSGRAQANMHRESACQ